MTAIGSSDNRKSSLIDLGDVDFDNLSEAPVSGYVRYVPVVIGHVYCFITTSGGYVKFKILAYDDKKREIMFKWVYQDNGTRKFGDS